MRQMLNIDNTRDRLSMQVKEELLIKKKQKERNSKERLLELKNISRTLYYKAKFIRYSF